MKLFEDGDPFFAPMLKTNLIEVEFEILTRLRNRT